MKVDFTPKLVSITGESLEVMEKRGTKEKLVQMTLGSACSEAMLGMGPDDAKETGKSKFERWEIASKIVKAEKSKKAIEMTVEDISQIKKRIGQMFGPLVVGPVYTVLETGNKEGKK